MNLLDTRRTPMALVFERIREAAAQRGVAVLESELVGLAPAEALVDVARQSLQFGRLTRTRCSKPTCSSSAGVGPSNASQFASRRAARRSGRRVGMSSDSGCCSRSRLALGVRLSLLVRSSWLLEGDDALSTLMALGILDGERPIMLKNQTYAAAWEPYAMALSYALFGISRVSAKLPALLGSLG